MSTSYPSNLSDAEWEYLQRHLPPLPRDVVDRQFTPCEPCSMRSSTCCAPAVRGATFQRTFHRGRPSSTISGVCASKGPGRFCCGRCIGLNANDKEGILTQ